MQQQRTLFALVLVLALVALANAAWVPPQVDDTHEVFKAFVKHFNKPYEADSDEFARRYKVFLYNLRKIEARNSEGTTQHGITKFADMAEHEFKRTVLMKPPPLPAYKPYYAAEFENTQAPINVDWRNKTGVLTNVYDQQQCGSCWAFSATENIESQWALGGHPLTELSMQQIVDCDTVDSGCWGGWPSNAYTYVTEQGGLDSYADYPYTAKGGQCAFKKDNIAATINNFTYITTDKNEQQMASYVATKGPISVCVDASQWSSYTGGVFLASSCPDASIDHCVLAVGYNLEANPPYWIIRNSWGTDWGLNGYMYLEFNKDACAVAEVVTSAIVPQKN